jgi:HD-GYP domain-containing protein (c-di-GMP phosphodiesterase class II)
VINPDTDTDPAYFTKAVTQLGEMRPVVTTQAIFNELGVKIIEKGIAVNAGLYERLMEHKLTVPLEQSVTSTPTVTGQYLRQHAEHVMHDVPFFARISADTHIRNVLLDSLKNIFLPTPIAFQLTLAAEVRPELFRHSVRTALFAAWMTLDPLVLRFDLTEAATAGLLHDIGLLHLDPVLLTPHQVIGDEQRRQLDAHPLISKVLIERHHEYSRELLQAVQEHHEFLDGSGYPRNLGGQVISPLGRILALGDLVNAMLASQRQAPELQLWVLLRMNKHRYDATLMDRVQLALIPHSSWQGKNLVPTADAVNQLLKINAVVSDWPTQLAQLAGLSAKKRDGMIAMAAQTTQLRRTLASVGASSEQLEQMGDDALDDYSQLELALLAQEAAWQLRFLARQAKRRWSPAADAQYPAPLQEWLDRAESLTANIHSPMPAHLSDTD